MQHVGLAYLLELECALADLQTSLHPFWNTLAMHYVSLCINGKANLPDLTGLG